MHELKSKLNEMNYDMVAIINSKSLKNVTGGGTREEDKDNELNLTTTAEEPICKERAVISEISWNNVSLLQSTSAV